MRFLFKDAGPNAGPNDGPNGDPDDPSEILGEILEGFADFLMPFVRMYLGPAAVIIENGPPDPDRTGKLMLLAVHKFTVEAGTLPAPCTPYEPHAGAFSVDENGRAPALPLPYVLAALRSLASWAAAGPATIAACPRPAGEPTTSEGPPRGGGQPPAFARFAAPASPTPASPAPRSAAAPPRAAYAAYAPVSARALRMSARASGYAAAAPAAARTAHASHAAHAAHASAGNGTGTALVRRSAGGCGCRGAGARASSTISSASRPSARTVPSYASSSAPSSRHGCDCAGACGGRGCGCSAPATPPAPEACTPWSPSCEMRNRLRACLKDILCDLLRCIEEFICPGGSFGTTPLATRRAELVRCIADLLCRLLRCVREALCPPPPEPERPCPIPDALPCSYAVEDPS
jgi:hypothetical protein